MSAHQIGLFDGYGVGLRPPHFSDFLHRPVYVDFLEIISENFMVAGGRPLHVLDAIRERYPIVMHGVSMSVGSADGAKLGYLNRLKHLADRVKPLWVSDHLCWTGLEGFNSHDLLPLPYTEEALDIVCTNVRLAQDVLERALVLENPSSYMSFHCDEFTEWAFLTEMCRRTGCYLLLDVNNVYVNATNQGFDPREYIAGIPTEYVRQIHLAGHSGGDSGLLIDTHDHPVSDPVWALYALARQRLRTVATLIERDDDIPPLDDLLMELNVAREKSAPWRDAA